MPVKKEQSVLVFQDKMVLIMGIILTLVCAVSSGWILHMTTLPTSSSLASIWICRIISISMGLVLPFLFIVDPYRYIVWYRFSPECITYHTLFRRKKVIPYSAFPYVMHGKYLHGIYWRHYIVFSNRRLKESELNQINHVAPSPKLIKVQYSKKTYRALLSILPPKYRSVLNVMHMD